MTKHPTMASINDDDLEALGLDFDPDRVARPGFRLASFKDAALPVYALTVKALVQERKPINPIEEGCLRAIDAGLAKTRDIQAFLGLGEVVLNSILASLNAQELINYMGSGKGDANASLTIKGRLAVEAASKMTVEEVPLQLVYDPYLKRVEMLDLKLLYKPASVKAMGRMQIPLCGSKKPEAMDIQLEGIDRLLELRKRDEKASRELLAIQRIERRETLFRPCTLLYFRAEVGRETQVAFYLDDQVSLEHEAVFRDLGGPQEVGAAHVLADQLSEVASQVRLTDASSPLDASTGASSQPESVKGSLGRGRLVSGNNLDVEALVKSEANPTLSHIRCQDHPMLLQDALLNSKDRLLIISPWIRDGVVTDRFVQKLDALLRSGVKVYIGYGLEEGNANEKPSITPNAESALTGLTRRHPGFTFIKVGNTHRKMLVCDQRFAVVTSFNWLSYKGDVRGKPRDEVGICIRKPEYIEQSFQDGLSLLRSGYR
jgi:hypothetical protein